MNIGAATVWGALGLSLAASVAHAHKPSDTYLTLTATGDRVSGHWDIALRDLDRALVLDADGDGALTWAELSAREAALSSYALRRLKVANVACAFEAEPLSIVEHSDGPYARLPLSMQCATPSESFLLEYDFLFDLDAQHRSVVRLIEPAGERTVVLGTARRSVALSRAAAPMQALTAMIVEGVKHILGGLDHILFLLALLLPVVLRPGSEGGAAQLGTALRDVIKVITAFTVAHSLTLGLAWLGIASAPASLIEPAIAASVAVAAIDNIWPMFGKDRWSVAFALGLLHGFGFSSALIDGGLSAGGLLRTLFAFNLGVELGQLAIVLAFVPLAFVLSGAWFYRFIVLRGGSLAIVMVSLVWLYERIGEG